ncbi:MAG TPA: DUF1003 domain-containing protein [Caulobacteraceae bacterium]|nr:DUF1003 domain-containing protein [Caulobacteraceae bacterium]
MTGLAAEAEAGPPLPPHIEQTVQTIARLHAAHHRRATTLEKLVDRVTTLFAHPWFIATVALAAGVWIVGDVVLRRAFGHGLDRPGFPWLQLAGELLAICITSLVLMSQRRKDELSELREQLTLELVIMTEQKVAKLIELQEEARRDNPLLADRVDHQAAAMSAPADPEAVLEAFKESHETMLADSDDETDLVDAKADPEALLA